MCALIFIKYVSSCYIALKPKAENTQPRKNMPPFKNPFLARQQGVFLVMFALSFILLLALSGFFIDLGMIYNAKTELKTATDNAALSGALKLNTPASVNSVVQNYLQLNPVQKTTATNPIVTLGDWDDKSQTFTPNTANAPTAVKVTASFTGKYVFARIFNLNTYTLTSTSIASCMDSAGFARGNVKIF